MESVRSGSFSIKTMSCPERINAANAGLEECKSILVTRGLYSLWKTRPSHERIMVADSVATYFAVYFNNVDFVSPGAKQEFVKTTLESVGWPRNHELVDMLMQRTIW
jgi:hypothetical protein